MAPGPTPSPSSSRLAAPQSSRAAGLLLLVVASRWPKNLRRAPHLRPGRRLMGGGESLAAKPS